MNPHGEKNAGVGFSSPPGSLGSGLGLAGRRLAFRKEARTRVSTLGFLFVAVFIANCTGSEFVGRRGACERGDCESGLVCVLTRQDHGVALGTCELRCDMDGGCPAGCTCGVLADAGLAGELHCRGSC